MGGVLLASVALAWVFTLGPRQRVTTAKDILADIRANGLAKHWGEGLHTQWGIVYEGGRPDAWQCIVRGRLDSGEYVGMVLNMTGGAFDMEEWRLNADATAGSYGAYAGLLGMSPLIPNTTIGLKKGVVTVNPLRDYRHPAESTAPENYLPEGLWDLAARRVAQEKRDAQFEGTFNNSPNHEGGRVEFVTVQFRYAGEGKPSRGTPIRRVEFTAVARQIVNRQLVTVEVKREYQIGPAGEIVATASGNRRVEAASEQEVQAMDPRDVRLIVQRLLPADLQQLWAAEGEAGPETDTKPGDGEVRVEAPSGALLVPLANLFRTLEEIIVGGELASPQLIVGRAADAVGPRGHFAQKVDRRHVVPGGLDLEAGLKLLVAVERDADLVVAVPGERDL